MKQLLRIFRCMLKGCPPVNGDDAAADFVQHGGGAPAEGGTYKYHECVEPDIKVFFDIDPETMLREPQIKSPK
jgi:hypothetical protein